MAISIEPNAEINQGNSNPDDSEWSKHVSENQEFYYPSLKDDIWRKCHDTPGFIAAKYFMWMVNPETFSVGGVKLKDIETLEQYEEIMYRVKSPWWGGFVVVSLIPFLILYILCNEAIREQFVKPEMESRDFTLAILYYVLEKQSNV
jgi:hypothetical protein